MFRVGDIVWIVPYTSQPQIMRGKVVRDYSEGFGSYYIIEFEDESHRNYNSIKAVLGYV